jgi:hypothetical protein
MKQLRHLFLSISFLLFSMQMHAAATTGATIALTKTANPDEYEVSLYIDRFCIVNAPPVNLSIEQKSNSLGMTVTGSVTLITTTQITGICVPNGGFSCPGGTGMYELFYHGLIMLPPASDWIISFSECCRNFVITNLSNAGSYTMYVKATLDNLNFPGNSTPAFNANPSLYECLNLNTQHINTVTEPDGDSIAYTLINPMDLNGSPINNYYGGLNANNFLVSSSPINIDPLTGIIDFTPSQIAAAVMVVKATEYRNGVACGSIMRDLMLNIITGQAADVDVNEMPGIYVYPVPATDYLSLNLPDENMKSEIKIYNSTGELVLTKIISGSGPVDVKELCEGLYVLRCNNQQNIFTSKFVKM